ncbi:hypothetical protein BAUCODRAFT_398848 [Baudoinia panamericana UAMH 10762]|uniref:F-box domain-containing protein n=1 Tax=Baudoinia panamericana (strain UAMH 10762) TaxID=717646 RepID=M2N5J7_BAUPA|nr:uncharacterized protein BAUCODRAFT_398848 [Baudoinia panamericana UAMH 10762]EMC99308.1 hypothetical protein BAUCODRAFT_398848 [Baudoinia panamericana UAMH 10762]
MATLAECQNADPQSQAPSTPTTYPNLEYTASAAQSLLDYRCEPPSPKQTDARPSSPEMQARRSPSQAQAPQSPPQNQAGPAPQPPTTTAVKRSFAEYQTGYRRPYRTLAPAPPPKKPCLEPKQTSFFDLPAELRIHIYELVLVNVRIQILPLESKDHRTPHALILASRQVRNEVLPIIHSKCRIRANVTDFNFSGLVAWMDRIPSGQQAMLCKNEQLEINLCTSLKPDSRSFAVGLRKWLEMRKDPHRSQPNWQYSGPTPKKGVASDLRRRAKRMNPPEKRGEFLAMLDAIGVVV